MKRGLIIALGICALAGILIPFVAHSRQFYYLLLLAVAVAIILIAKGGKITIYDCLVLVIFSIPFHGLRIGGTVQFVRLSELAFLPLFFWWLAERALGRREPLKIRKEFLMAFGFLVINILATTKSMYPAISIKRIFIITYLIIFCHLVSNILRSRERFFFIMKAMIVVSALSGILAMLQAVMPRFHILLTPPLVSLGKITLYRAKAGWFDPNYYALYMAMNIALTLSFLFSRQFKQKKLLRICLPLQLGGLLATFSRMGHICFLVVFLFLLAAYGRRKLALSLLLIILLLLAAITYSTEYIYEYRPGTQAYFFRVPKLTTLQDYPRLILVHRWDAFRANWRMFLDNPWLGVGPFMAMYNYSKYMPADAFDPGRVTLATHNQYLQLLSEKGVFGFVFFMGFILLIWRKLGRYIKQWAGTPEGMMLLGLKGALIAYLVASLVGETTHELQFWLTMGLSLGLFSMLERPGYRAQ